MKQSAALIPTKLIPVKSRRTISEEVEHVYSLLPDEAFTIKSLMKKFSIDPYAINTSNLKTRINRLLEDGRVILLHKTRPYNEAIYCKLSCAEKIKSELVKKTAICIKCGSEIYPGERICQSCKTAMSSVQVSELKSAPDLESTACSISNDVKNIIQILQDFGFKTNPQNVQSADSRGLEYFDIINNGMHEIIELLTDNSSHTKRCFAELIAIQKKQLLLFEQLAKKTPTGGA
jgi:hypothetical protein